MQKIKRLLMAATALFMPLMMVAPASAVAYSKIYNNIPTPIPGNVVSQAFEATQTSEFGGQVQFAGSARTNPKVTVLMSSWGCENGSWNLGTCNTTTDTKFTHAITLNIYDVGTNNAPGLLLASKTQSFAIPYRPSVNTVDCTGGRWSYPSAPTVCFNGLATPISFDLTGLTLPEKAIIGVAYNTSHYGQAPIGENTACYITLAGCGYDSLNVGVTNSLTVGSYPLPKDAYLNSKTGEQYCPSDQITTGSFRLDKGCWRGYQPAFMVETSAPLVGPATSKDQCKNDGWKKFNNPTYKNQGDCVSAVASNGKAKGNPQY